MIVYRVAQRKRAKDLSGRGAFLVGGRWTPKGVYALYAARNASLAAWEVFVHQVGSEEWPVDYCLVQIQLPDKRSYYQTIRKAQLPKDWDALPYSAEIQNLGRIWFQRRNKLGVFVPSAVMKGEQNVILNPQYPRFKSVVKVLVVESFQYDARIKEGVLWK